MAVLAERIAQLLIADIGFLRARDRLQADRTRGVHRIHEARVVRRDADAEQVRRGGKSGTLLGRQRDGTCELVCTREHVAELPAPVVPLRVRDISATDAGHERLDDGEVDHGVCLARHSSPVVPTNGTRPRGHARGG